MALKPRLIRRWRKEILRCGTITRTEILNKDDDGSVYSDKRDWGYVVECNVNGYSIGSYGSNWYEAWQGAVYSARWAVSMPAWVQHLDETVTKVSTDEEEMSFDFK